MNVAVLMIAVSDIRPHCKGEPDIVERLKKAMVRAQQFWMSPDDQLRFRAAVAAALLESPEDEKERIARSHRLLVAMSAAIDGLPVDMEAVDTDFELLPLIGLWHAAKNG